jgi:tripartite-type tricarboxylate transporter receptor subunit TctC
MNRASLAVAALCLLALGIAQSARAEEWPQHTIRLVVPFGAGGGSDIVARILAESMQKKLGQAVIVENKPGAGGVLGNDDVAKAVPDGYTIGIMTAGQIIAAVNSKNMPYDANTAFASIGSVASASMMIVTRPDFPADSIKDLIALAKANPGKITMSSPGFIATQHFAGEMFKQIADIDVLHVPYKSSPEAINAVLGKHADFTIDTITALNGQVQSGQVKVLAVTGKDRFASVPNIPAAVESGLLPGYDVTTWYGLFAPKGTPPAIIAKFNKTLLESLGEDDVAKRLVAVGVVVKGSTPQEFDDFLLSEYKRWDAVREAAHIERQ